MRRVSGAEEQAAKPAQTAPPGAATVRRGTPSRAALGTFAVGILATAVLAAVSLALYNSNENRLLKLRVRELGLVLTGALADVETPLASAAELADATAGNPQKFAEFMAPYVGPGKQFVAASLWPLGAAKPTVVIGGPLLLNEVPGRAVRFFARAERTSLLSVTGLLGTTSQRIGYEFNSPGAKTGFAVYVENAIPHDRHSRLQSNTGFADLSYAIYLGRTRERADLLVTDISRFPISGRHAAETLPFGDSALTLVVAPDGSLGGTFFERLPWVVAVLGLLLSLAAAAGADRLAGRRRHAEQLAADLDRVAQENRRLYNEQRGIAQTLQHALLPESLPQITGLQSSACYIPAALGVEIGGDWYDIVALDEHRALLVVGDVSGHGLRAATTMAALRYAALAYAAVDPQPAVVLEKLSNFANGAPHDYFATVLCCLVDVASHGITLASAGHPAPLLVAGGAGDFVEINVGVPIGVSRDAPYEETSTSAPGGATLVAFTDGLVERRGEVLDVGLGRLREAATAEQLELEELVARLAADLASDDHHDDTAIVALRWVG